MFKVFLREKPAKVLTILKDSATPWYLSKIALATGTTYVYVTKLISNLERKGFVKTEIKGKKRIAKLTEKGEIVANLISELEQKLEEANKPKAQPAPQTQPK